MISHSRCAIFKLSINKMMNVVYVVLKIRQFNTNETKDKMSKDNLMGYNQ